MGGVRVAGIRIHEGSIHETGKGFPTSDKATPASFMKKAGVEVEDDVFAETIAAGYPASNLQWYTRKDTADGC